MLRPKFLHLEHDFSSFASFVRLIDSPHKEQVSFCIARWHLPLQTTSTYVHTAVLLICFLIAKLIMRQLWSFADMLKQDRWTLWRAHFIAFFFFFFLLSVAVFRPCSEKTFILVISWSSVTQQWWLLMWFQGISSHLISIIYNVVSYIDVVSYLSVGVQQQREAVDWKNNNKAL